ncbi:MAG: PTS sugar transporter subunit IIA [Clostridia bacterium]|nr:PTS sugar transporter subunit IIA [Clostridia bacterium]
MIIDLLRAENIKLKVNVSLWKEAGKVAGRLLVETGKVEAQYVDAMLASVEKYGPYIVIAPGIALFHARPQDGVKDICMSLITVEDGINFDAGDKDPVKLVFAFGAIDNTSHLKALSDLMLIVKEDNIVEKIINTDSKEEVLTIIKNILSQ